MNARRIKSIIMLVGVVLGALTLLAWTQDWFVVTLVSATAGRSVPIGGDIAGGGLAALGLAGLALVGALSIAGRVFRAVLGVLEALIGLTVTVSAVTAIADPVHASASAITTSTGIAGHSSVESLVASASATFWPGFAAVVGIATVVLGVIVVITGRSWPASSRKYQAVGVAAVSSDPDQPESAPTPDSVADWDALSDGSDPTSR